jgi:hypothetical protein
MELKLLKRTVVISLMFVVMISLFVNLVPSVLSLSENVEVLGYSWYISSINSFIVVGEVQNVGPNNIEYIALRGFLNSTDGQDQAWSTSVPYSSEILPQQKVPFVMYFFTDTSISEDFNWISGDLNNVEYEVIISNETDNYQYPDLEIINESPHIDSNGIYTITGRVQNTGNQAAGKLWVVGTFYNSTGSVIATGFSDYLTPDSLQAGQTTSFTLNTVDTIPELENEMRSLAYEITDYALLIQTEAPIIPEFPSWIILPLFVTATLGVITYRKKLKQ